MSDSEEESLDEDSLEEVLDESLEESEEAFSIASVFSLAASSTGVGSTKSGLSSAYWRQRFDVI